MVAASVGLSSRIMDIWVLSFFTVRESPRRTPLFALKGILLGKDINGFT